MLTSGSRQCTSLATQIHSQLRTICDFSFVQRRYPQLVLVHSNAEAGPFRCVRTWHKVAFPEPAAVEIHVAVLAALQKQRAGRTAAAAAGNRCRLHAAFSKAHKPRITPLQLGPQGQALSC